MSNESKSLMQGGRWKDSFPDDFGIVDGPDGLEHARVLLRYSADAVARGLNTNHVEYRADMLAKAASMIRSARRRYAEDVIWVVQNWNDVRQDDYTDVLMDDDLLWLALRQLAEASYSARLVGERVQYLRGAEAALRTYWKRGQRRDHV